MTQSEWFWIGLAVLWALIAVQQACEAMSFTSGHLPLGVATGCLGVSVLLGRLEKMARDRKGEGR